ncbi:sensor histidine kinase [Butyrivibrio sp. AE3004]|uniref:sensor histidine kinase n=1 Tax=Butyrivibrio sp. AE3004 TaxID=1506994 RepID=UPI00068BBE95|nr:histidine kinase [Butyrivibrio sp. AE3004]
MSKEIKSFQENIRRTFILYSITPVIAVVFTAIILFVFTWSIYIGSANRGDNLSIGNEISGILNDCYAMVFDSEKAMLKNKNNIESAGSDLFKALYDYTEKYEDIGKLILITPDRKVLFSSDGDVPECLIEDEYSNWGVWNRIKASPEKTLTVLYDKTLYVVRGIYNNQGLSYAIIYEVPSSSISDIIYKRNRYCTITDSNGWVYLNNTQGLTDEFGQINGIFEGNLGIAGIDGTKYMCYESKLPEGLMIYTFSDITGYLRIMLIISAVIAVIFMAIIIIAFRSTATSSEIYTRDVKKIEDAFEAVSNGDLEVGLKIDSSKEFQIIGNDFNKMLDSLKTQIDENRELAENVAFAQVKRLESQFDPHFLFNTLDNIRFMAKIDADAADKMIVSLSGLLRYSIRETKEEVTIREDLDNLQYYLNILQIRFNKRFAYDINVPEDIRDLLIPKLLIQPLLENAVKYGFGEKEKLTVNINGYQHQGKLIFICEDDGVGIDDETLAGIKLKLIDLNTEQQHIGIYNIHKRIKLMYKGDYGLDITSKKGEGTTVRLVLPIRTI